MRTDELPRDLSIFNPDLVKNNINAKIHVNKKPVLIGEMPWIVELMHDRIEKAVGNVYLTSLALDYVGNLRYVS